MAFRKDQFHLTSFHQTSNERKADDRRWAQGRKAFNTRMAKDDALYARMTRRQRQQVQVDSGLRPTKQGLSKYVGGKSATLAGLKVLAARMVEQMAQVWQANARQARGGKTAALEAAQA